ncbi:MAG: LysR family transcriptional regulator [Salibaculum sp.]|jgi:molybdate transport repressor ModE-like protein|uniref:LysR family transcriptional regulator n=1 Tax=Salibaculum sp. TaxID=2855480 RepID=UPI0028703E29|nr:LysR family transcriptional regulator [Salibaculum sp.]MDR9428232.1 LysR family transcriptional regulator [Salibaculum sp.]
MIDAVTLKQLRSLKSVAETGSITEAATRHMLSPPAIHSQIRNLERLLDVSLLTKGGEEGRLCATPEGRVLIAAVERIDGVLDWARDNLDALERGNTGHVRLGFESTGRYFAPRVVSLLRRSCGTVDVTFDVANRKQIIERFDMNRIDLAIMGRPPRNHAMQVDPIAQHPFGLFVPPDHHLVRNGSYDPEALMSETIFAREPGSGTRSLLDRFLDQIEGYGTPRLIELDANETIKECVMAGLGVAMLSFHVVQRELADGRLVDLKWPRLPVMRYWYLVSRLSDDMAESTLRVREAILNDHGAFVSG